MAVVGYVTVATICTIKIFNFTNNLAYFYHCKLRCVTVAKVENNLRL